MISYQGLPGTHRNKAVKLVSFSEEKLFPPLPSQKLKFDLIQSAVTLKIRPRSQCLKSKQVLIMPAAPSSKKHGPFYKLSV